MIDQPTTKTYRQTVRRQMNWRCSPHEGAAKDAIRDAFHDGVILALQVLNASGDCGNADYTELVNCCGVGNLVKRATHEDMMELSGLDKYTAADEL